MELNKVLAVAKKLKEKQDNGGVLLRGEEAILILVDELNKATKVNKTDEEYKIGDSLCVEIIEHYKKRTADKSNTAIAVQVMDLDMILDAIMERLYK